MQGIQWQELTVGVAAIVGLVMVSVTMRRVVRDTLSFLGNHLSNITEAQNKTAVALDRVCDRLEQVEEKIDQYSAMAPVGRRVRRP